MSSINRTLLYQLRQTLLKCDEFQNPAVLFALMADERLSPWQSNLPGASSVGECVDLTIDYLAKKEHINGENALVLLLQVLAERRTVNDQLQRELLTLAKELRGGENGLQPPPYQQIEGTMDQQLSNTLLDVLCNRLSPSELRMLVFKVLGAGAYHNLSGGTHTERSIAFLEAVQQRQKGTLLLSELGAMRPDALPSSLQGVRPHGTSGEAPKEDHQSHTSAEPEGSTIVASTRPTLTWLHLSDLHFRKSRNYDENIVLKALLRDVAERIEEDGIQPDFVAITGDLAFSGKPEEYGLARDFFDELLKITALPRERLFVVPGNHDVDRDLVTNGAKAITNALVNRDSANALLATAVDRRLIMARFEGYADFVNDYFGDPMIFDDEHYFYGRSFTWPGPPGPPGPRVMVMGLNSAWACASDQDKTPGVLLGERQTRAALELAESGDLKIALLHHPFDWLREFDQNDSAAMLLDHCDFILHGHLHRTATTQLTNPDASAMVIGGGACYETRQYPNMYNFVRLDLGTRTGTVYLRRYSDERGGFWTKDVMTYRNAPDGMYVFQLRA